MPVKKIVFFKVLGANFLGLLTTWLVSFFTPIAPWLIAVGFFVAADFITGIFKAKKLGIKVESKIMFKTVPKFIAYGVGIIVAHVLTLLFFKDFPAVKLVAGLVAFIEIKSLDENIKAITGTSLFGDLLKMLNPKKNQKSDEEIKEDQDKSNPDNV